MITLVDNTVLSNYANVQQITLITTLFPSAAITTEVKSEFGVGVELGRISATNLSPFSVVNANHQEQVLYENLSRYLGKGEAESIAIAYFRKYKFLTDDKVARKVANQYGVSISGSIGILIQLVKQSYISLSSADALLHQMIAMGYRSPTNSLNQLLHFPKK